MAASLFVVFAAGVRAQESGAGAQLSIVEPDSCISESRVRERVQQYRGGAEVAPELRVRVERREEGLGFVVFQSGEPVARRRLTQLSAACDERLDTLAIAIAVALTNATKESAAAASTSASPPLAAISRTHSGDGQPNPASRQPSTAVDQASHTARSVADDGQAASARGAAQPKDARHPRHADQQPIAASLKAHDPQASVVAQTRNASGAERHPSATSLETHDARTATASVDAETQKVRPAGTISPPTAATSSSERRSPEAHARNVSGAELQARAGIDSGVPSDQQAHDTGRSDGALVPPPAASPTEARAGTASGEALARDEDARTLERPTAVRDQGDDGGLGLVRGSRAGDVGVMAGARYGLELLPEPLFLFDAGLEVGLSRVFSLAASGLVSPVKESAADGGTMHAQVTGGELLLCARPTAANVILRWCAGVAAASVSVRGKAFFVDRDAHLAWAAGLMRAAVRWPANSPVAAELSLGGHANLVRPRMRVLHSSEPDRVSRILGGSLGLQLVVSLR